MSARKRKQEEEEAELKRKNTDAAYQGKCFLLLLFSLNIILIQLIELKMNAIHKSVQFISCVPGLLDKHLSTLPKVPNTIFNDHTVTVRD